MAPLAAVILAAGLSTRMRSKLTKVLHPLAGKEMLSYPIAAVKGCKASRLLVVRNPDQNDLGQYLRREGIREVVQKRALGTADAVQAAEPALSKFKGHVLIVCGDIPLVRSSDLSSFISAVRKAKAAMGIITIMLRDPAGYGRIVRDLDGKITRIVEEAEATPEEKNLREVNTGVYCVDSEWLFRSLKKVGRDNAKDEYYLTDLVGMALKDGVDVLGVPCERPENFLGINTRVDLARAAEIMRERINKRHMLGGVGILDFRHTEIEADVRIGADTKIMPCSFLLGKTRVGPGCIIENGVVLKDAAIGRDVHIKAHSVIENSRVADGATIGPFARIRPESRVGRKARVGNFVELKKCDLRDGAKANHLAYLGDASVGAKSNIGCGTITCNYDGAAKHRTVIGNGVFVGSDTQFIAPVRIGRGATIGAGSTITRDVPPDALALSRAEQRIVRRWTSRKKQLRKKRTSHRK